ncbi:MAG: polyribonucleotide nucleotidyltransferase [bacterium]|nr:polyribonucleotide nucleotidyltransferase [bacterium]
MSKITTKSLEIGNRTLSLETGRLAGQADSAVLARYGDTMVLATVVSSNPREGLDYFPLGVEYVERLYAGGRIKGSRFIKREGRPSDDAVLAARAIDRSIRPLFPKGYMNEVQVIVTVLSVDLENSPEILAAIATSAALSISSIPWNGPIGVVEVGSKDGICFVNPVNGELEFSDFDLTVSSTAQKCLMLEASGKEVSEKEMLEGIKFGTIEAKKIIGLINDLTKEVGKKKQDFLAKKVTPAVKKEVSKLVDQDVENLIHSLASKENEHGALGQLKEAVSEKMPEVAMAEISLAFEEVLQEVIRERILEGKRADGRKIDEIRPISAEVGVLPRTHGSAIFSRGETQVLTVTTLGSPSLGQLIESPEGEETKRYLHHYSFPPFSTGETGRVGTPSRREIGHGALAEKALLPVIPSGDKFPYTVRLVSEVLSSNGSTSQASICGSTLSLMDAGVPLLSPVAGLALGLIEGEKKSVVLSDIIGMEDHHGDMDFKVAGSKKGITAIQLDVKNQGLTEEIIAEVLERAKVGREFILEKMLSVLPEARIKLSKFAPKVAVLHIPQDKIGEVIGPGGRMIRKIIEETGATVDIEDSGQVNITGEENAVDRAVVFIENLTKEVKPGELYEGEVKRIQPFGAFVEVLPGKEGLVHVSRMSTEYVSDPNQIVTLGQKVQVRVSEIDDQGRINLSMILDPKDEPPKQPRSEMRPRPRVDERFERPRFGRPAPRQRRRF